MEGTEGDDRFFALAEKDYLRQETKNYVPQIIAAALIAKEPAKYGMTVRPRPALAYDSVTIPASTPLSAVAKAADVPLADLTDLNPHILRGMTPPGGAYLLRIPAGREALFTQSFARLPIVDREPFRRTESRKGETLRAVAARMNVSTGAITMFNANLVTVKKGKQKGQLRAGQAIRVPVPGVLAAARDVPDPAIERYGSTPKPVPVAEVRRHTVKRGESLGAIAKKYDTSTDRLKALNKLKSSKIVPGASLIVRRAPGADADEDAEESKSSAKPSAVASKKASAKSATAKSKSTSAKPAGARGSKPNAAASKSSAGAKSSAKGRNAGKASKSASRAASASRTKTAPKAGASKSATAKASKKSAPARKSAPAKKVAPKR
jgi:membrane-bound lytic murein transglycosylase D